MKHIISKGSKKGTIVFIHGNSSSSNVFKNIMETDRIKQTKIAVDLPGHGSNLSGFDKVDDFSVKSYCDKLVTFINNLNDDILLVGNSLGGHLAIEISDKINSLKGLVIFGTPPIKKPVNFEEAFIPSVALQTFLNENPTNEEIETAVNKAVFNKKDAIKIIKDFKSANPKVRKAVTCDLTEGNFSDEFVMFTTLKIQKLIIVGKNDPSPNPTYLEFIKNECNGNCELKTLDECGHYPSVERPNEFIQIIKDLCLKIF